MATAHSAEGFACILRWLYNVWRCSITPAFTIAALMPPVFLSGICIVRVKTRSPILAGNDPASLLSLSPQYLNCLLLLCVPYLPLIHFTSGSPFRCKTVCAVVRALCCPMSTPYEDVCETFTQRGYKQLQEAALGTNQAENPLIPVVTIRCGMLTWYRTGWCLRWWDIVRRHSSKSWGFALKHHDKGTKPTLWSLSSIMTGCMSSIGTDLIYVCSV